mgnify:CR=1 FL=1
MDKKNLSVSCEDCEHLKVKVPVSDFIKYEEVIEDKIDYDKCIAHCALQGLTMLDQITPKTFRLGARLKANVKNYSKKQIYKDWTMASMCPNFVKANLRDLLQLIRQAKQHYELVQQKQNKFKREEIEKR